MRGKLSGYLSFVMAMAICVPGVRAANQYWDTDSSAGIQGGDGVWSTAAAKWSDTSAGTALSVWTTGNSAWFARPSNATPSTVTVGDSLTVGSVMVTGSVYTLIVTNGGRISGCTAPSIISSNAANNTLIVTGSGSMWDGGTQSLVFASGASASNNNMVIKDGAVVTNGPLILGTLSARLNTLAITNATLVTGSSDSYVGGQSAGSIAGAWSNRVYVLPGGTWNLKNKKLYVGARSAKNALIVDGGVVTNANELVLAQFAGTGSAASGGNTLIVTNGGVVSATKVLISSNKGYGSTVIVTGTGSVLRTSSSVTVASDSYGSDRLEIVNGGQVWCTAGVIASGGNDNTAVVSGTGSLWNMSANLIVGNAVSNSFNSLLVTNGGTVVSVGASIIGNAADTVNNCLSNGVIVTGSGSVWTNSGTIQLSVFKNVNNSYMSIADSGSVYCAGATIGAMGGNTNVASGNSSLPTTGNWVSVTGPGSLWSLGGSSLIIGAVQHGLLASNNWLTVEQGGVVTNVGTMTVYTNNGVNLLGGFVTVRNLSLQPQAWIGIDTAAPGGIVVTNNATLNGTVEPLTNSLPHAGTVTCTVLTCAGTLSGGLTVGALPQGYIGRIVTNLVAVPNEVILIVVGPQPGTVFRIR